MDENLPELPSSDSVSGSSKLAALFNFFQDPSKKKIAIVAAFLLFVAVFGWWAHQGFTLSISKFFASGNGPEVVLNSGPGPYNHNDRISVSWSKTDAVRCDSLNGFLDTGGATEGTANSPRIDACAAGSGDINIECTFADDSVGNTVVPFSINQASCPGGPGPTTAPPTTPPAPTTSCKDGIIILDPISFGGGSASTRIKNNSSQSCQVSFAAYQVWLNRGGTPPHYLEQQTLFDNTPVTTVGVNQSATFNTTIASCRTQVDLVLGSPIAPPLYSPSNLLAFAFSSPTFCDEETPAPTAPPTAPPTAGPTTPPPTAGPTTPPATVAPTPTPTVALVKTVRNITQSGAEADSVAANPSDVVEFIIRVTNNSAATVVNAQLNDVLPTGLSYNTGSTQKNGATVNDGIVGGGIALGDLAPGTVVNVNFQSTVTATGAFSNGVTALINVATVTPANTAPASDNAYVTVTINPSAQMTLYKFGRNVTNGEVTEQLEVIANPGDIIEFIIRVKAAVGALTNVIVSDILPSGITYIQGSTTVDGNAVGDNLMDAGGLNIGSLGANQEAIILFKGQVSSTIFSNQGKTTVINTAKARADNVSELIAQLPIVIIKEGTPETVPTGAGRSLMLAVLISAILTFMYVSYTQTGLFRRSQVGSMTKGKSESVDLK